MPQTQEVREKKRREQLESQQRLLRNCFNDVSVLVRDRPPDHLKFR